MTKPRASRGERAKRLGVLDVLIGERDCKWSGQPFAEWVEEHRAGIEAGIEYFEAQGDEEGRRKAASLRETLQNPRRRRT